MMTDTRYTRTVHVLQEIMEERAAQDRQWGEQNHPLHSPEDPQGLYLLGRTYHVLEQAAKQRFTAGERSGALILLEEVFEALSARSLVDARTELVQVAAVAVMIVESIDRARRSGRTAADKRGAVRPCDVLASPLVTGEGTRTLPAGDSDSDHPHTWGGYSADMVIEDDVPGWPDPRVPGCPHPLTHNAGCGCPSEIPTCGADGCTTEYCPGGKTCTVQTAAHSRDGAPTIEGPFGPLKILPHLYNGAGRLHGICRCGEDRDAPVHTTGEAGRPDCGECPGGYGSGACDFTCETNGDKADA